MHSLANVGLIPGRRIDPKLMDVVGYPHSVINGTIASNSEDLPESQTFLKKTFGSNDAGMTRLS